MELLIIAMLLVIGAAFAVIATDLGTDTRDMDEPESLHGHHVGIG
ncbi:MAG: hypothetical protein WCK58_15395 [Chloroflexota bacterium]